MTPWYFGIGICFSSAEKISPEMSHRQSDFRRFELRITCRGTYSVSGCTNEYINTLMKKRVLEEPGWSERMTPWDLAALSPLITQHINPYERFELDMDSVPTSIKITTTIKIIPNMSVSPCTVPYSNITAMRLRN